MEKMTKSGAIKHYFERKDQFAPEGGRPVPVREMSELFKAVAGTERDEMAQACAAELGVEIE